jgi:hypothetical protein
MTNNNGWPEKPGVPLNPERDGWHWLVKGDFYTAALWHRGHFTFLFTKIWPEELSQLDMTYIGPALTPAEVDARVADARRDALEEAARAVEMVAEWGGQDYYCESCKGGVIYPDRNEVATAIRALKGAGDD